MSLSGATRYSSKTRSRRSIGEISGGFSAEDVVLMVAISAGARRPATRCGVTRRVAQDARHALGDAAKDLVAQRPRPAREIVDGDLLGAVAADERHGGAQAGVRRRHVGDVDHQHVHAHGADDGTRRPATSARGVAHVPRIAVGVADGKRGDRETAARPATGRRS